MARAVMAQLGGQFPRSTVRDRDAPHLAVLLGGGSVVDRQPRLVLVTGGAGPGLQDQPARGERLPGELGLGTPGAVQPTGAVPLVGGQRPARGERLVEDDRFAVRAVGDLEPADQYVVLRVDPVAQHHVERVVGVGQAYPEGLVVDRVVGIAQFQAPRAVGELHDERRLVEAPPAPRHDLLGIRAWRRPEVRVLVDGAGEQSGEVVRLDRATPVEVAELPVDDGEGIGTGLAGQHEATEVRQVRDAHKIGTVSAARRQWARSPSVGGYFVPLVGQREARSGPRVISRATESGARGKPGENS